MLIYANEIENASGNTSNAMLKCRAVFKYIFKIIRSD